MMRNLLIVIVMSGLLTLQASAQMMMMGIGPGQSGAGTPTTPCNAGQLDFSDGCNTTQYMVILR